MPPVHEQGKCWSSISRNLRSPQAAKDERGGRREFPMWWSNGDLDEVLHLSTFQRSNDLDSVQRLNRGACKCKLFCILCGLVEFTPCPIAAERSLDRWSVPRRSSLGVPLAYMLAGTVAYSCFSKDPMRSRGDNMGSGVMSLWYANSLGWKRFWCPYFIAAPTLVLQLVG